jgi:hypothetical protein
VVKLAVLVLVTGCLSAELAPIATQSRTGPASARTLHRIVALPATCGSLQILMAPLPGSTNSPAQQTYANDRATATCGRDGLAGIDQVVRSELDFAGYQIIDAERLNAVTASRHEIAARTNAMTHHSVATEGARFEDATPREQADILRELGADGVLATRVWFGNSVGTGGRHDVAVQVRLAASADRALAWARRCDVEVGVVGDAPAAARAARCAAGGRP